MTTAFALVIRSTPTLRTQLAQARFWAQFSTDKEQLHG